MADYRDWSSIPPDLILIILKNLPDLGDFIRFHAVCSAWRSAVLQSPYPSPFLPLLLDHCSLKCCLHFHSPFARKLSFHSPDLSLNSIKGPSHSRMLSFNEKTSQLSLFNPVTGDWITLPSLGTESAVRPFLLEHREMVVLSKINGRTLYLWSCQVGDVSWCLIKHPVQMVGAGHIYFKGMCYVNESLVGPTAVLDPSNGNLVSVIPPPKDRNLHQEDWKNSKAVDYLVESSGRLLRIYRFYDIFDLVENCYFEIHRLDYIDGCLNWVKVGDLGDQMLFLDRLHGISKSSDGIAGARGNCIYFTKYCHSDDLGWSGIMCRYDIGSGKAEALPGFLEARGSWVVPSLF